MSSVEKCERTDIDNLGMIIVSCSVLMDCMHIFKTNKKQEQQFIIGIIQYTNALNSVVIVVTNEHSMLLLFNKYQLFKITTVVVGGFQIKY